MPITVAFWNSDWAKKKRCCRQRVYGRLPAGSADLSERQRLKAPVHTEIISKHTGVSANVLVKTRAPFLQSQPGT